MKLTVILIVVALLVAVNAKAGGPCQTEACYEKAYASFQKGITKADGKFSKALFKALLKYVQTEDASDLDALEASLFPTYYALESKLSDKFGGDHSWDYELASYDTEQALDMAQGMIDGWFNQAVFDIGLSSVSAQTFRVRPVFKRLPQ